MSIFTYLLDTANNFLKITNLGNPDMSRRTLSGLPGGTVGNSVTGEAVIKVSVRENVASGAGGGLTDTQLRATPVPISGTITAVTAITNALPAGTNTLGKTFSGQYSGAPSTSTPATADGTVFTLAAGEKGFIQNLDDAALAVRLAAAASSSAFSFILKAGTAADDGLGGSVEIKDHIGVVSVAAMSGTARYIDWKQAT